MDSSRGSPGFSRGQEFWRNFEGFAAHKDEWTLVLDLCNCRAFDPKMSQSHASMERFVKTTERDLTKTVNPIAAIGLAELLAGCANPKSASAGGSALLEGESQASGRTDSGEAR